MVARDECGDGRPEVLRPAGTWQHHTLPVGSLDESAFDEGLGFDGSSIRGWQGIEERHAPVPDAQTDLDPFTEVPTLSLLCEIAEPVTLEPYAKTTARREARRRTTCASVSPTRASSARSAEFFVFDEVCTRRPQRGALQGRFGGGPLELRQTRSRLHDP
jgi:glutamine synthetase